MTVPLFVVLLSTLSIAVRVEGLDLTLKSGASGADVVRAVISKIETSNSFINFTRERAVAIFMRRMAYVETKDGNQTSSNGIGIWNINEDLFRRTQHLGINARFDTAIVHLQEKNPQNYVGPVNWRNLTFDNLSIPLYCGLAVRMLIHLNGTLPLNHHFPSYWVNVFKGGRSSPSQWNDGVVQLSMHEGMSPLMQNLQYYCLLCSFIPVTACELNIDLVFVLDESGSIGDANFQNVKVFVHNFTENLLSDMTMNRVGVITFSSREQLYIALNSSIEKDNLLANISNLPYDHGGQTRTALGLELMRQQDWRNEVSVLRLAIVLTDGQSSNKTATLIAAQEVHDHEPPIVVYAIGVGDTDPEELQKIASGEEFFIHLNSFDENVLDTIRDSYSYQICFTGTSKTNYWIST